MISAVPNNHSRCSDNILPSLRMSFTDDDSYNFHVFHVTLSSMIPTSLGVSKIALNDPLMRVIENLENVSISIVV